MKDSYIVVTDQDGDVHLLDYLPTTSMEDHCKSKIRNNADDSLSNL